MGYHTTNMPSCMPRSHTRYQLSEVVTRLLFIFASRFERIESLSTAWQIHPSQQPLGLAWAPTLPGHKLSTFVLSEALKRFRPVTFPFDVLAPFVAFYITHRVAQVAQMPQSSTQSLHLQRS